MRRLALAPLILAAAACGTDTGTPAALAPSGVVTVPPAATTPAAPKPTTAPPAAKPPVAKPPAAKPPVAKPPVAKPPVAKPPVAQPPAARPSQPAAKPRVANDVDGDGRSDALRLVEGKDSLRTGRWELRVTLSKGGTVTGVVSADPQVRPAVHGVADADLDGDGEVFVRTGGGASTTTYTPYTLVEDGMAEVRTNDGKALRLSVGGTVTHGDGFSCADVDPAAGRELVVLSVVSDQGTTFRGTRVTYRWRADRVDVLSKKTFTGQQGDPAVEKSYELDCDGI
ncbi:MAG TPA: hypothetical protein VNA20_12995 [Frankiaceae bacterium]|nr:hypothetical protein [Frankiaceae bacterium]